MVSYLAPRAQLSQQTEQSSISYDVYMERKGVSNEMHFMVFQKFLFK
jgi:hypothetical protein